jgi:hypothetical protein
MLLPSRLLLPFSDLRSQTLRNGKSKKHMKNIALSVLIVLVFGAVLVATLSMFEVTKEAAKPIVGGFPLAIPAVHQLLQKSGSRLSLSATKRGVVSLQGYTMPVVMLALYGFLILLSTSEIMGFLTGFAGAAAGVTAGNALYINLLAIIPQMIVAYFVGRWIGVRSKSKGLFATLAVAFSVPFIDLAGAVLLSITGKHTMGEFLIMLLISAIKYAVPAVFGYWRGRVIQLSRYLAYLLRALPQESRDALVNLASDEAKRLASNGASQLRTAAI